MVRAVLISWRPFHKAVAEPHLTFQSSYYRLIINGDVKDWKINPTEDMREMSHSQIHEALDEDNWMVTIFGHDFAEEGGVPAPSAPASRPRTRRPERALPPRQDDVLAEPEIRERKEDDKETADAPYEQEEEFETGSLGDQTDPSKLQLEVGAPQAAEALRRRELHEVQAASSWTSWTSLAFASARLHELAASCWDDFGDHHSGAGGSQVLCSLQEVRPLPNQTVPSSSIQGSDGPLQLGERVVHLDGGWGH